ncbi:sigma-54-dependent transcriptional regulator [Minwuia thermotolerans]|uniref:Sigma-54-dependent Fis family transcriptional regulator n=1 Tax=Minwuia thermotolerans TaxID=2056226 RepID=A0A2M9G7A6_9PROT|nr:sigma-54 dependent transcriptional regulator [Minwuia thermotolerans]PJK31592.1 sigma-54-dependent Fis family transcriptional regulator [Minwuia thermotolerans]
MSRTAKSQILLVEDTPTLARSYIQFLRDEPYDIRHVETGAEALAELEKGRPDAILLDLRLPDMDGMEILRHIGSLDEGIGVIVITAHGSVQTAVTAMRLGAADFIVKPFTADRLKVTLRNVLETTKLKEIVETYRTEIDRGGFEGFVGSALCMQAVYRIIEAAASSKATVFITGESGTGKEVCAEAIKNRSPRRDKPFIAINCAAIPHDLMESEIFGHVKGAFTGALGEREGAAAMADGGTLFLDEICEMDLDLQAKLLRFIQTETYSKVGSSKVEKVDVRVICATNKEPMAEVKAGRFREDLYYRLHVIPMHLPPLRERDDDILRIAETFLRRYAEQEGKSFRAFGPAAAAILMAHEWPGNVRELQNAVHNIVVLNDAETVTPEMLPANLQKVEALAPPPAAAASAAEPEAGPPRPERRADVQSLSEEIRPLAAVERDYIENAIERCGGNIRTAAALLGIAPQTIYRKRAAWEEEDAATAAE